MMNVLTNMFRLSNTPGTPTIDGEEISAEADEPPDDRQLKPSSKLENIVPQPYTKARLFIPDAKKESLLTRALLLCGPEPSSIDCLSQPSHVNGSDRNYPPSIYSNISGPSTAELTSDGETKTPPRSDSPSPPIPSGFAHLPTTFRGRMQVKSPVAPTTDIPQSEIEANLGRKRLISFACGRKIDDESKYSSEPVKDTNGVPKRKSVLTFICAPRPTGESGKTVEQTALRGNSLCYHTGISPLPLRKPSSDPSTPSQEKVDRRDAPSKRPPGAPRTSRPGEFELSDAIRFHEFGSSLEDDDWVNQTTVYKEKMTLNDCMKKELAIRKLGEEAEEEARQDEEDAENDDDDDDDNNDDDDDDEDDDDDDGDEDEDDSTLQNDISDAGNESDNEAGFADSDDTDNESEYAFWAPSMATASTSVDNADVANQVSRRRGSCSSTESSNERKNGRKEVTPPLQSGRCQRHRRPSKPQKYGPSTPHLPDSTDFVCGTLDEDRPLEAAYISCMEQRRRAKHILIPQDIDPSFPTTDPEDEDGDDDENHDNHDDITEKVHAHDLEGLRGRPKASSGKVTPSSSPKRLQSPPPRRAYGNSPRRLRSPPPVMKSRSPPSPRRPYLAAAALHPDGMNITDLTQRPHRPRTRSLPRTPNPFFARLERRRLTKAMPNMASASESSNHDLHTRGPIDIVVGLEKKRQKRKEKFWRQHCRKAAKENLERKPLPGKGAERMKELGLEVAERFKAYGVGVGQGAHLVLSI
ncbi:DUF2457 superfamily domain-containing protein [Histoplasma capsulatum var. duboisii H88]|uniref:DUF2457 superfamily domain-containing protein n=2 Tax=Ajellomyces capsulatus (strain H88) TaxID=544711 RepID=A0A8A1LSZ3_AJEC8|nr:DUF2457 superfamily domain-containing protein [Histoplasma capsulatum var. duboisii H88]